MIANNYEFGMVQKALAEQPGKTKKKKRKTLERVDENAGVSQTLIDLFSKKTSGNDPANEECGNLEEIYRDFIENGHKKPQENEDDDTSDKTPIDIPRRKKMRSKDEDSERSDRTVFVGNVSLTVTRKMLKKLFLKYGEIESVRIRSIPTTGGKVPKKVALIKQQFHSERHNMNAYVVYKNKESAEKSLQCNGYLLESLHLRVDKSERNKAIDHKCCLFVGNLPFNVSEEDLRAHFQACGSLCDVRVIRDKSSGMGKGFGYVRFADDEGVMLGLKLNGSDFKGRMLRIFRSKEQNSTQQGLRPGKPSFRGLRSTSNKDLQNGRKQLNATRPNNALLRIQNKQKKQTKNRHLKNSRKNVRKKVK